MSNQRGKGDRKSAMNALRAAGINPLEVMQCIFAVVVNSGKDFTFLMAPPAFENDDDDGVPDDFVDRITGYTLDNVVLGFLPIDDTGCVVDEDALPAEVMTVGGTPLTCVREGHTLILVDPLGTRSTIQGVISRGPKIMGCKVDKPLMVEEWFGDEPLSRKHGQCVDRFELIQPSSVTHALGEWKSFDLDSAKGGKLKVRSLLGNAEVRERMKGQQLYRVRCTFPCDESDGQGKPIHMRDINRIEDTLALRLAIAEPRCWPLGVVSGPTKYDLYYGGDNNRAFAQIISQLPRYPFDVTVDRLTGATDRVIASLTPPSYGSN